MKTQIVTIRGTEYRMAFTCEAMFRVIEELKIEPAQIISKLAENTRDSLSLTCRMAQIFSEEAQIVREYQGYQKEDTVGESLSEELRHAPFGEIMGIKKELIEVINSGFMREIPEEQDEVDLGLEELKKKEENQLKEPCMS